MEDSFADEVSALYYMNLFKPSIDVSEMKMRHNPMPTKDSSNDLRGNLKKHLLLLVQEVKRDPSIGDWVKKWRAE